MAKLSLPFKSFSVMEEPSIRSALMGRPCCASAEGIRQASSRCAILTCELFWAKGNGAPEGSQETLVSPLRNLN